MLRVKVPPYVASLAVPGFEAHRRHRRRRSRSRV